MVNKLRACGAIVLGKTYLPGYREESPAGVIEDSTHGKCRSAYGQLDFTSSGGAVAVSSGFAAAATIGHSTAGVIIPAAQNACYAIRPTPSMGPFLVTDSIGPVAKSARDLALLLTALGGPDPSGGYFRELLIKEGKAIQEPTGKVGPPKYVDYTEMPFGTFKGKRLGVVLTDAFAAESWGTHG